MSGQILAVAPALLCWAGAAYKLPALLRTPQDATVRAFWLSVSLTALALTILIPSVASWIDDGTGVGNLSRLLSNALALLSAYHSLRFHFLHLEYPDGGPERSIHLARVSLVATVLAMTGLFLLAPVHRESADFWQQYGGDHLMLASRLLFLGYLALGAAIIAPSAWHYAGIAERLSLSLGLRFVAIGCLSGLGYAAHEGIRAVALTFGHTDPVLASATIPRVLITGCVALMLGGSILPTMGARLGLPRLLWWIERHRIHRRLYLLWYDLYQVTPDIAYFPPRSQLVETVLPRDFDLRLYRRIIEIRDGMVALRHFVEPWVMERTHELGREAQLSEQELRAVIEAVWIAAGLQARRQHRRVHGVPASLPAGGGSDVRSEAVELDRVARSYRRSPIVHTILWEMDEQTASPASGR